MNEVAAEVFYLLAAILFIVGLKRLASPATARSGNQLAALGMAIAVIVTLLDQSILSFGAVVAGLVVGTATGAVLARRVEMTAMPQLVAAFNGFGGGASAFVAAAEYLRTGGGDAETAVSIVASTVVGALTLSGSFVAYGKLQGILPGRQIGYPGQPLVDLTLAGAAVALAVVVVAADSANLAFWALAAIALVLGITRVLPIGGADMPVVIAFLNSLSGIAASAAGFVIDSNVLIISGALVGASGLILTSIMVRAMNRTLGGVLFSAFGGAGGAGEMSELPVKRATADDVAITMAYAQRVIVVPGYGLAVAQAQHALRDLTNALESRGVDVRYAIHPVAGRMPGHMNVLLAEADIPYDRLFDLEDINREFSNTDVALVVGANDVVNPAAREDTSSPIYGMPILDVDHATTCVVIKRSLSPGFAGIDNPLFYLDGTLMLFDDAKEALVGLVDAMKQI